MNEKPPAKPSMGYEWILIGIAIPVALFCVPIVLLVIVLMLFSRNTNVDAEAAQTRQRYDSALRTLQAGMTRDRFYGGLGQEQSELTLGVRGPRNGADQLTEMPEPTARHPNPDVDVYFHLIDRSICVRFDRSDRVASWHVERENECVPGKPQPRQRPAAKRVRR